MNDVCPRGERGMALLAVLFALTLLALLALPFAVSMSAGADAAMRDVEQAATETASASVRELLLADAALSHPAIDPTPSYDTLDEWPAGVELPEAFTDLGEQGRVLLGGEIVDLQRFLQLDSCSPLLLANALGAVTRLTEDLTPDARAMPVEDARGLPEAGAVWVAGELIRYAAKDGNTLQGLERGVLAPELADGTEPIAATALVLDYRCVLAAAWPGMGPDRSRRTRRPYRSVGELLEIEAEGFGTFAAAELDVLQRLFSVDTMAATAATWGRPERVFVDLVGGESRTLVVKSALHLGAGSAVRLRNLRTGDVEHGLVMRTATQRGVPELSLPSVFLLDLLFRVGQSFPASDTVVEPLIPAPVNVNTASAEVLAATLAELRVEGGVRVHEGDGPRPVAPPWIRPAEARALADDVVALRAGDANAVQGPFSGWRSVAERLWQPRLDAVTGLRDKQKWIHAYRNVQTGRDSTLEMGTAPWCFQSGPWVGYRAAASRSRSRAAPGVVGRHERTGLAAALPGFLVERRWVTQESFEDAFALDRRAPFWTTLPINLGALAPGRDLGNDPASRWFPHLAALAVPQAGFGAPRFPSTDETGAGIQPAPATAPLAPWPNMQPPPAVETFLHADDTRGHDVGKAGAYRIVNTGPSAGGAGGQQAPPPPNRRHDQLAFPFSTRNGFADRVAARFWIEPQNLVDATLFDHGVGDDDRNRLSVQARDGQLVLEVADEAGVDPDPGQSPAGIERTVAEWSVPLAEIGLPANTPLHVAFAAPSGRPADLSLELDGMVRGKPKYVTHLTAALPVFDPELGNNRVTDARPPGTAGNERYVDVQVESTEGFPPVGTLRIGLELFEYSSINGNSFRCRWVDSLGGRAARQIGREHRPNIPTDPATGEPTVDIDDPQFRGVNLDVFPDHPAGSLVELYGYSALLAEDSPMMAGKTTLAGAVGGWAVARGFVDNARPIVVVLQNGSFQIGVGIDETWTGDLELADPIPDPLGTQPPPEPPPAQAAIHDAFPAEGGYALLVQRWLRWERTTPGALGGSTQTGGVELVRYASREGNKLSGVQRAQRLPGQDGQIDSAEYDGTARRFVTNFENWPWDPNDPQVLFDHIPTLITWVVPVSIAVQNGTLLWDPQRSGLTEWAQIRPRGGRPEDLEWVRYDVLDQNRHLVRANRAAWDALRYQLTLTNARDTVPLSQLGPTATPGGNATPPWGTVSETSGYIGYVPRIESLFPQILAARQALQFRGDPRTGTSSHAHTNADVTACHRLQLRWGNHSAFSGRVGRHDRVALVQGSAASGTQRPQVEWHTVTWQMRRYEADNLATTTPPERLGPWPFQLAAFDDAVGIQMIGPPRGTVVDDPRRFDRLVKFPSGELPAAYCEQPAVGAGVGNDRPLPGFVDEIELVRPLAEDLVLDEPLTEDGRTFVVDRGLTTTAAGALRFANDLSAAFPVAGGLVQIDTEVLAYQARADGTFTVATNGRGLLGTEARGHDRGARVKFLTHRPAAILAAAVGVRDAELPVQARGALSERYGTVLLGGELLHYTWVRIRGEQALLEMPRHFPPGTDRTASQARGLFRGRFGTAPQAGSQGEPVIAFPFRFWDRYAERSDDPELAYFQLTTNEAPAFFRTLRWREQTNDPRVLVVCSVRADGKLPWEDEPLPAGGLWHLRGGSEQGEPHRLAHQAARLEIRFATEYRPGCVDLATYRAHGWKTTARVEDVRLEYEAQGRIFAEQVTAR